MNWDKLANGHGRGYECHNSLAVHVQTREALDMAGQILHHRVEAHPTDLILPIILILPVKQSSAEWGRVRGGSEVGFGRRQLVARPDGAAVENAADAENARVAGDLV